MNRGHSQLGVPQVHGLSKIMRLAFAGDNLEQITARLLARIQADGGDAAALLDVSVVLQLNAQPELALELQSQALRLQQHYQLVSNPEPAALRLLAIMGPGEVMANTPLEFLIEDCEIALDLLYLGEGLPAPEQIPDHDVAFVAVCESDHNQELLQQLAEVLQYWPRPFINHPQQIAQLSRNAVSAKLSGCVGLVASDATRMSRAETLALQGSGRFPLIARPVDSHAGNGLSKLIDDGDLNSYMSLQSAEEFYIAPFIEYRGLDGWYRKYRIVVIDGQPFAAHMAVSQKWMVHYLNADMLDNPENRLEEAHFMATFDTQFAVRHAAALQEIDRRLGLEYYSIDCAETVDGRLLVFELDSGAVVHAMDSIEIFPYKLPQMQRVFAAFRQMLYRRSEPLDRSRVA